MSARMPVWQSAKSDPIRAQWLYALVIVNSLCGGICVGLPAGDASPVLLYISGGLLLVSAVLVAVGWSVAGGVAGAFGWGVLVANVLFAIVHWTALWCIAPVVLGYLALQHALVMYEVGTGLDRARERRQRRR